MLLCHLPVALSSLPCFVLSVMLSISLIATPMFFILITGIGILWIGFLLYLCVLFLSVHAAFYQLFSYPFLYSVAVSDGV